MRDELNLDVIWEAAGRECPARTKPIQGVVLHYTGAGSGRALSRWVAGKARYQGRPVPPAKYFAHFVVCRDGTVIQQVHVGLRAPHAAGLVRGRRPWPDASADTTVNDVTVGIEHANYGLLIRDRGKFYTRRRAGREWVVGKPYPRDYPAPVEIGGRWWEPYTPEAMDATVGILRALSAKFPRVARDTVVDHSYLSPGRKQDPGPAFPRSDVLDRVWPPRDPTAEAVDDDRYLDFDEEMCVSGEESGS